MTASLLTKPAQAIHYPDSDGKPMAENTLQFRWIVTIQGGFDALYRDDPNVFVAGDLLWYPVEGHPEIRQAPDALIVFGRPKGYRGSYIQHREGGIAPQVVFEVLSPGNTIGEMTRKLLFYQRYGVEEYYLYDPDHGRLEGWIAQEGQFEEIAQMQGWVSPRTSVQFALDGTELLLTRPDGQRFKSYLELDQERMDAEAARADAEAARADAEAARVAAESRVAYLVERLRAAGIDPDG
ncbi:MAG: Uma2 family endonuclease [Candidatus Viridilinea halotolerans]|uniref:Uma2 family endonuclease n=1 Tax=Candidatus Viridilinea halotolerans TaxID=2491704 RepID=A0A426U523_9CHLR|nr:MAG: Uma2 family endonuclease [Candidatus Viridilinea halotolerans]